MHVDPKALIFLPFMMLGMGVADLLCNTGAAHWAPMDVALLSALHAVIFGLCSWAARRRALGMDRVVWGVGMGVSYLLGLVGLILVLRPELIL